MNNELPKNILEKIKKKHLVYRYFVLVMCMILSALSFNLLQLPTNIVSGGTGGVAIIIDHVFGFNPSLTIFVISSILLVISFIILGPEKTSGSVVATILYPLFVELTLPIVTLISIDTSDMILISIFIGIINGVIQGFTYKVGFSSGGFAIVSQILYQVKKISAATSSIIINGIIVIFGGLIFGWTMVMYSAIIIYISSIVMDKVLLGISKNKTFYIITKKESIVKDYVLKTLGHGITIYSVKGGFEENRKHVLMTVVPNRDYFKLTHGVKEIDESAFFIVEDSYQTSGGE